MKYKLYYLFYILTLLQVVLAFKLGYFLLATAFVSLVTGLIYHSFHNKGLLVSPLLVLTKFVLSCATIYISYQTLRTFLEEVIPNLNLVLRPDFSWTNFGWNSVGLSLTVDTILILLSAFVLIIGLFFAKRT